MAFHGGNLERTTDIIAAEVAERTGSSYYGVIQAAPFRPHIPSTKFDPTESDALAAFVGHVDTVIAVHGYGRDDQCPLGCRTSFAAYGHDWLREAGLEYGGSCTG